MKLSDFQKYIDLYGADLSRWPAHEIRAAIDLIQRDPAAGKILSVAEKLDHMLRHYPAPAVSAKALTAKIMRQGRPVVVSRREKPSFPFKPAYLLVPGGGFIIAAIVGLITGSHAAPKERFLIDPVIYAQGKIISDTEGTL